MDTNSILDSEIGNLQISDYAKNELDNTRKWTLFLSILGILMAAMVVVLSVFIMTQLGGIGMMIGFIYILMSLLIFFPYLFLYRFSNSIKTAVAHSSTSDADRAFNQLKAHFRFVGVLAAIGIAFFLIGLLSGGAEVMQQFQLLDGMR